MRVPYLELSRQQALLGGVVEDALLRVARSGWYVLGPELEAFEHEFADWCRVPHVVGVGNGLDALKLALRACGVGPGDEVVVPANTYVATWLAVSEVGAVPVPVDADADTHLIDASAVEKALTPRTRAVIPVHLYGLCADVAALEEVVDSESVAIISDAAQAHGSGRGTMRAGAFGTAEAFSFYPTKNLGALGDAGAVTTADQQLYEQVKLLRNYGSREKYSNEVQGVNSRMDELQAAVLRAQLPFVDAWNARRAQIAAAYTSALADLDEIVLPTVPAACTPCWHVYNIQHPDRDRLRRNLQDRGVGTQIFYPVPPHRSRAYAASFGTREAFPRAIGFSSRSLALPVAPYLTDPEVDFVISHLRAAVVAARE